MLAGVYDIITDTTFTVEIDPQRKRWYRRIEGPLEWTCPMLQGFSADGYPIVMFSGIAREFEKQALAAFKAAARGGV